jgi:hypothetical protein
MRFVKIGGIEMVERGACIHPLRDVNFDAPPLASGLPLRAPDPISKQFRLLKAWIKAKRLTVIAVCYVSGDLSIRNR